VDGQSILLELSAWAQATAFFTKNFGGAGGGTNASIDETASNPLR
jgi:hypothetical protein